jgi:beta-lactamase superfamily II metal-dependent hydrolase
LKKPINDASYVIVYHSQGGRILLPGDAHNKTWDYVLKNYENDLKDCEFMIAPHHGRDSGRSWDFLDKIKPKFSVLGCASSEHLAYDAWNKRGLEKITQNQAGNIAVYPNAEGLNIYVENDKFAKAYGGDTSITDSYGNYFLTTVDKA